MLVCFVVAYSAFYHRMAFILLLEVATYIVMEEVNAALTGRNLV
jgi:hypothetical protein